MIIVTAGNKYLDIDAYASGIAYANLLRLKGKNAIFASSAILNGSIPKFILDLEFKVERNYVPKTDDQFIVVDLSNPEYIDGMVKPENIIEIIDHHTGFENYWKDKCPSQIEFIGSVATIVFEKYEKANMLEYLSPELCKLLVCAILDNTLNLKSDITTKRDLDAYKKLRKLSGLNKSFDEAYFLSCQEEINADVVGSILSDIKQVSEKMLPSHVGQLTIYDKEVVFSNLDAIFISLDAISEDWMLNLICLKDGKSYIFASNQPTKDKLQKLFKFSFNENVLTLPKFKLRKEIIKLAQTYNKPTVEPKASQPK